MKQELTDLALLSRSRGRPSDDGASSGGSIPLPSSRWKTRIAVPGIVLAGTAAAFLVALGGTVLPATEVRVVPVMVKAGLPTGGRVVAQAPGWIEPDPFHIDVSVLADGVVEEMLVLEGESVKAGQVVARLIDDDARLALDRAEATLKERQAALEVARATLEAAQRDWDNPIELTRKLSTTEAMLAERQAELDQWPSDLAVEKARADELEADLARIKRLDQRAAAADIEVVRTQKQYEAQLATLEAMKARKPILEAQVQRMQAEVDAAREDLRLRIKDRKALDEARASVVRHEAALAEAKAARDEAALRLDRMEVRSPVDGVVMVLLAEPGVKRTLGGDDRYSAVVCRLYEPAKLQVRVDVPLVDAARVGVGQRAEVIAEVLPDRVFHGEVTRVVHAADLQKNTLQMKVAIEDPSPDLKPEMLARARFLAPDQDRSSATVERVLAPKQLVHQRDKGEAHVWLADQSSGRAVSKAVVTGRGRVDGWIEIEQGLQPGDRLIADPPSDLQDGDRIRIVGEARS